MSQPDNPAGTIAYIGLGGNIGNVLEHFAHALRAFENDQTTKLLEVSPVYRTPPWGMKEQDDFLNACIKLDTSYQAKQLLDVCKSIEKQRGRERKLRWGPRTMDLDILVYGSEEYNSEDLVIPHPRMTDRLFVLKPLHDLTTDLIVNGQSIHQWLEKYKGEELESLSLEADWWKDQ